MEGAGGPERRVSSRCRSAWARPIALFCVARPHARIVSLWSSFRRQCARRAARSLLTTQSCATTVVRGGLNMLRHHVLASRKRLAEWRTVPDQWSDEWRTSHSSWWSAWQSARHWLSEQWWDRHVDWILWPIRHAGRTHAAPRPYAGCVHATPSSLLSSLSTRLFLRHSVRRPQRSVGSYELCPRRHP